MGLFVKSGGSTLMNCPCRSGDSEIECNSITLNRGIFITGIFNIQRDCSGKEIIKCDEGIRIGKDERFDNCEFKLSFFQFRF